MKHTNVIPTNIDHIPSNTTNSGSSAMLCVFEDNEAVIKMIIKGRSPTMRHVSRTHRVTLDWLFDRIQNQKEEERVVSMSRSAVMNISSFIATSSSTASSPIASQSPGMPIALGNPDSRMSIEPSSFDAASTSQVRLKDAYLGC